MKILVKQAGRQVQRMRNILAILLVLFVCTSICLGETITINGDIVNHDKVRVLEQREEQQQKQQQKLQEQLKEQEEQQQKQQEQQQQKKKELERKQDQEWLKLLERLKEKLQKRMLSLPLPPEQEPQEQRDQQQMDELELQQKLEQEQKERNHYYKRHQQQMKELERQQKQDKQKLERQQQLEQQQQQDKQKLERQHLESEQKYSDIAGNGNPNKDEKYKYGKALEGDIWNNPNNNHLFINPGAKVGNAYGAKMNNVSVIKNEAFKSMTNNDVIVSGGEFGCGNTDVDGGYIAGAWADYDIDVDMNISSNTVIITGGTDIKDVYGGRTKYGTVSLSTVTISSSVTIGHNVYGGYIVRNGTATLNKVNLTSVTVRMDVCGAQIGNDERIEGEDEKVGEYGLASSNEVTITGGRVGGDVLGGYIVKDGTATENKVDITSVTVTNNVYGAMIGRGLASSNTVTITSGKVRYVYGGYIFNNGTATENKVDLTSVTVTNDVYGASIKDGLASSNTVTITSGTVGLNVYGGYIVRNGTAIGNKVNLSDVDVTRDVYGGYIVNNGTATLNKVNLRDVDVTRDVYGAKIGNDGDASSNEVTITGGRVGGYVLGGYVYNDGTATGNKVTLTNVDVTRDVYGAKIGTDKKAEFERAEEEMTESFERLLTHTAKYAKADAADKTEFKRVLVDARAEAARAITAIKALKAFNSLAAAAKADIEAIDEVFEVILGPLALGGIAEIDEVQYVKEVDKDIEVEVSNGTERAQAVRDEKTERAKSEEKIKEKINKFKAEIVKYKRCVIAEIERAEAARAETYILASSNTVTITSGTVGRDVYGGYIVKDGTATLNAVNLTGVTATKDVYGVWIGGDGLASSNTVTITSGTVGLNVYGGYIVNNGTATGNTVTINGGKIVGNVFGGYVGGNGEATHNTINITASTEFSPESILCGGICDPETKSNAVTGNTLNIETKGVMVKGISNFEKYKFHLKDIKAGETILTATSGGCSWNTREHNYTSDCAVDISRSNMNISLHTQGVLNKGDQCTLIKSPHGFEGKVETEQFEFENEGLLIKYYWDIKIADNKQELIAKLIDKKIRDGGVARSLSEGYGSGVVCVNNGMDCIFSKMEETEKLSFEELSSKEQSPKEQSSKSLLGLQRKGEIGAFGGVAASKSKYDIDNGSHIDMIGMSMMGGVGVRVEVGRKEQSSKEQSSKEQNPSEQSSKQSSPELSSKKPSSKKHSSKELGSELTVGVFAEHGTGESDIHYENKNEGKSSYTGGGLLGRYNIYENEFSGTKELSSGLSPKIYVEAILRAGQVENKFDSKKMKDGKGKEYKYKYADAMYGGCAVGGGYKHKVSEKIDLDWSLRYMFGRQWEKDVKREDADGNRMKFENVTSNRIRIGVRGKYVELEKIKPYAGIGCEYELDGKVKGTIQNGVDIIGIPASDFGGVTGIGELGVSGKVWKFGVDISGQGYLGVRKGFGGMLKLKYAFGKR